MAAGLALLVVAVVLFLAPSNDYIFLPDRAHPVAPLVEFPGSKNPTRGGVYFVDVVVRKATLLERLFGGLHKGADIYPASAVNPPGVGDAQRQRIDLQDMQRSQQIAAAVALRAAGKKVVLQPIGGLVDAVEPGLPAVGKLDPDDTITAVDGRRVRNPLEISKAMLKQKIGAIVDFTVRRNKKTLVVPIKTVASDQPPRRAVVGILLETALDIHLPFPVRIDTGNIGGPSAGLAFALEVMEELGRDVVHGHKIAATGEIFADGSVGPIGGIKQKTIGAREAGVDAFLVPAGENAHDARKEADGLRIIPVESFPQALHALATLGPKT
ncbi:MAG: S16 family serine protease [Gaiellaceae bacterium]